MGKKASQASKKEKSKDDGSNSKKHINDSLIKVLRPKVYITDSSTFKSLVQTLTGCSAAPAARPVHHRKTLLQVMRSSQAEEDNDNDRDQETPQIPPEYNNYYCYGGVESFSANYSSPLGTGSESSSPDSSLPASAFSSPEAPPFVAPESDQRMMEFSQLLNLEKWLLEVDIPDDQEIINIMDHEFIGGSYDPILAPQVCVDYDDQYDGLPRV